MRDDGRTTSDRARPRPHVCAQRGHSKGVCERKETDLRLALRVVLYVIHGYLSAEGVPSKRSFDEHIHALLMHWIEFLCTST